MAPRQSRCQGAKFFSSERWKTPVPPTEDRRLYMGRWSLAKGIDQQDLTNDQRPTTNDKNNV
jgi:hypothetical protein